VADAAPGTLKYSSAAQLGSATDTGAQPEPIGSTVQPSKSDLQKLLDELPSLDDDDLRDIVASTISRLSSRRIGGLVNKADLKPSIRTADKIVVLPDTFKMADNKLGHLICKLSRKLGYHIKLIPYDEAKLRDISEFDEKIALGMYLGLDDGKNNFRFNKKTDPYEIGRAMFRSQQIIGALGTMKFGPDILKINEYYFGNRTTKRGKVLDSYDSQLMQQKGSDKKVKREKEDYWIHSAPSLVREGDISSEIITVLVSLLRQSWSLVDPDTLWKNIVPYTITYAEVVQAYCTRDIVVSPAAGKRPAVTKTKVPSKPGANSLFLKDELSLINDISACLWQPTPWEKMSHDEWCQALYANTLSGIKKDLVAIYTERGNFLAKLASCSTKRLQEIRRTSENLKNKRKSDITAAELSMTLIARDDHISRFASEIMSLDPNGTMFIKEWSTGKRFTKLVADTSQPIKDRLFALVARAVASRGFYDAMLKEQAEKVKTYQRVKENAIAEKAAHDKWIASLAAEYGSETINKWSSNLIKFDYLGSLGLKPQTLKETVINDKSRHMADESSKKTGMLPKPSSSRIKIERKDKKSIFDLSIDLTNIDDYDKAIQFAKQITGISENQKKCRFLFFIKYHKVSGVFHMDSLKKYERPDLNVQDNVQAKIYLQFLEREVPSDLLNKIHIE
jgi:hypothetical protein